VPSRDGYIIPAGDFGSPAGGVQVNIINPPTQPTVTESRDANGMRQIQVVFEKMLQSSMAEGKFDNSLRGRFGLRPVPGGGR
jgi:hypothetical protein